MAQASADARRVAYSCIGRVFIAPVVGGESDVSLMETPWCGRKDLIKNGGLLGTNATPIHMHHLREKVFLETA